MADNRSMSAAPPLEAEGAWPTAAVFALSGVALVLTVLPGPHWHDTAEFAAVGWRLSLSHSPGHPAHALLTRGLQLSPLGDGHWRAGLLSALCLAAALALFYRLLRRLAPPLGPWPAGALAITPLCMPTVWLQGARPEVYTLQLLLTVLIAEAARRVAEGRARALPAMALAFGLAGANHSFLGLMLVPLALWAMAVGLRRGRSLAWAVPAGALGLATYLYLPLRAHAGGPVGWGRPDSLARFWATLSAREWRRSDVPAAAAVDLGENVATLLGWCADQVGGWAAAILLVLLLVSVPWVVRRRAWRVGAAALVCALPFVSRAIFPLDLLNPDLGGYMAPSLLAGLLLVGVAVSCLPAPWARARWALVLVPLLAAPRFDPGHRRGARSAERYTRALWDEVPLGGALVGSDYATQFIGWSLRAIEGARPDMALIFRGQMHTEWFRARLAARRPEIAAALPALPVNSRFEPGAEMARLGELEERLLPVGLSLATSPAPSGAARAAFRALPVPVDGDGRRFLAYLHAVHAEHLLSLRRRPDLIAWHLAAAGRLAPGDPWLKTLAARLTPAP